MKAEEITRVQRSNIWQQIHNLVCKMPINIDEGDAPDPITVTCELEELLNDYARIQIEKDRERIIENLDFQGCYDYGSHCTHDYIIKDIKTLPITLD